MIPAHILHIAIKDQVVIATGANGSGLITNFNGMDNAYSTRNGTGGAPYFAPSTATSNGTLGVVNNNGATTWDSSLLALKTFLTGEQMIFFFNNNQTNSLGTAAQSLAAWARITVKDAAGLTIGLYDFVNKSTNGPGGGYNLFTNGGGGLFNGNVANYTATAAGAPPVAGDKNSTDYVLSGGAICVNTTTFIPVSCGTAGASAPINHNLGANQAAYAILFPELNTQLSGLFGLADASLALYTLSLDVRLGCDPSLSSAAVVCTGLDGNPIQYGRNLNNGFEQLLLSKVSGVVNIPEPGTLALAGLGLLGLAFSRRRT